VGYARSGFFDDTEKVGELLDPLRRTNPADPLLYGNPGRTAALVEQLLELDGKASRDFEQTSWAAAGDKWALGYANIEHWLLTAVTDGERVAPEPPGTPGSIAENQTQVDAYRLHYERYTVGLAFLTPQDPFTFGIALHYHKGGVRFMRTRVFDLLSDDPEALMRVVEDAPRQDADDWSFDAGLLVPAGRLRIGVVARNVLFDEFPVLDPPPGARTELGPGLQLRAGAAYQADKSSMAAVDLDLTSNAVLGAERKTRGIALGYERWMTGWLALRSGTAKVFDDEEGLFFALGTSVRLPFLSLDFGGRINRGGGFDEIVGGATVSF
jgi:hypothetical protein